MSMFALLAASLLLWSHFAELQTGNLRARLLLVHSSVTFWLAIRWQLSAMKKIMHNHQRKTC